MNDGYNFRQLRDEILLRSESKVWDSAKFEWHLESVFSSEEPDTCLCGHYPIIETCILRNEKNGNSAEVGNVCVKKFLGIASNKVFDCIRRIRDDITRAPNAETIELFYQQNILNDWEWQFSQSTWRKRSLSEKQAYQREKINRKILNSMKRIKI